MLAELLAQLLSYVAALSLVMGFASAIAAGRKIARYRHDAELAARKREEAPVLGIIIYVLVTASLVLNVSAAIIMRVIVLPLQLGIRVLTSSAAVEAALAALASFLATLGTIYASYKVFMHRYRRADDYLTREARLVAGAASKAKKASASLEPISRTVKAVKKLQNGVGFIASGENQKRPSGRPTSYSETSRREKED